MEENKADFFEINSYKASIRVTINSIMMGSLFILLGLIWTTNLMDSSKSGAIIANEIILAIPLLFVSSLAYLKIGYSEKHPLWNTFGWFTHNIGSIFILNVVGLMTVSTHKSISISYFCLLAFLMMIYSTINVISRPQKKKEKVFKFCFFLFVLALGGLLPALLL